MARIVLGWLLLCFVVEAYSLVCLKCNSTDVFSRCRFGSRSKAAPRRALCRGPEATCFVRATVDDNGRAFFERGCTDSSQDVCKAKDHVDVEFCVSCRSKNCNYDVMELDKEVEDYLNDARERDIREKGVASHVEEKKTDKTAAGKGIVKVLKELITRSSADENSDKRPENLVDEVLNDHFTHFGEKIRSSRSGVTNLQFNDEDDDGEGPFDIDVRMDNAKHKVLK
ncbi:unnamed protein product [Phyllotreta striolata]|uniref:Uncharacterized protein n=1 Tax=Phyllotreta striolata TaxID=444603 RepID=A0A9N9TKW8_PHYSR|nr:unnamed protein product [Phyllotreta striolata]